MTIQSTGNNGLLWRALAASLALHVLLLSPQFPPRLAEHAGAALEATLRPPTEPRVPAASREIPVVAKAAPVRMPPPAPRAVPPAPTIAVARPKAVAAHPGDLPGAEPGPVEAAPAAPAVAAVRETGKPAGSSTSSGGVDADGLREYRLALAREARRFRRELRHAVEAAGVDGTAQIRIELGADGRVRETRLAQSSGDETLDAAAVATFVRAAPLALVPASLRGRAVPVTLPVVFRLKDD